jgi:hypothetical protein
MLEADMPIKKLLKKQVNPPKGRQIKREKEKWIHKDIVNKLQKIQEVENRPLEMCMDVPFDLEMAKSITQPRGLNKQKLL